MYSPYLTRVVLLSAILVPGGALLLWPAPPVDSSDLEPSPPLPPMVADSTAPTPAGQMSDPLAGNETSDMRDQDQDQDLARFQHPAMQNWLQQEAEKIALREWFADPAGGELTAEQAAAAWSSEQVPGFSAYKERERHIIDEVNALASIPGGLSRQAYLRERLLEARIDAYGQARSDEP